jgi:hypothetical protein
MKLGQLIRMGGLALALATGMAACDDDDPGKADGGKADAATDASTDTGKADTSVDTHSDVAKLDTADGGADASDVSSETGDDASDAGTDSAAD